MSTDLEPAQRSGVVPVSSSPLADAPGRPSDPDQPGAPERTGVVARRSVAWVRGSVFPEPSLPAAPRPWVPRVAGLVAAFVAVLVTALRLPMAAWDSIWAEDGSVFLQQSLGHSLWGTLLTPYAGYMHALPRAATVLVRLLPLQDAGYAYTLIAATVIVWVGWTAWHFSAGHVRSPWLRFALAAAVVLVPAGGLEATGNIANSHFFLIYGAVWALIGRPRSVLAGVSACAMVLFATMSDPVALGLLPLALLRLVCLPRWRERAVALVYLGGMAVQLAVVLTTRRATGVGPSLRQVVFGYDLRVVSTSFLSLAKTDELVHSAGPSAVTYVAAVVVLALAAALLAARGRRTMVLVAAGASVAFFAVACYFSPLSGYPPTGQYRLVLGVSSRYTLVPALFLLTAWIVAAQSVLPRLRRGYGPALLALVAAPLVLAGVFDFRPAMGLRGLATDWSTQVQQARQSCVADENHAPIDVPIEPGGVMWRVQLDCSDLG